MKKGIKIPGTGFLSYRFIKKADTDKYDITTISPRNHFLFTLLLTSTIFGTIVISDW